LKYLIDTNIISEVRKGASCDVNVAAWYFSIGDDELYLSTLTLGEIRKGVEQIRPREPAKAAALETWLGEVQRAFAGRVLGIDHEVAAQWGRMSAIRPVPVVDALLAATAARHGLTLVTRNERDVAGLGVAVLNPFRRM
jgi:predicted nucleic acid-binding protein